LNRSALYAKTGKGLMQVRHRSRALSPEAHGLLTVVDGRATLSDLEQRLSLLSSEMLENQLRELNELGLIKEISVVDRREAAGRLSLVEPLPSASEDEPGARAASPAAGISAAPRREAESPLAPLAHGTADDHQGSPGGGDEVVSPEAGPVNHLSQGRSTIDLQKSASHAVMPVPAEPRDSGSLLVEETAEAEFMGDIEQLIQREMARQGLLPAARPDDAQPPVAVSPAVPHKAAPATAPLDEVEARLEALLAGMGSTGPEPAPMAPPPDAATAEPASAASPRRHAPEEAQRDALSRLVLAELDAEDEPPVEELLAPAPAAPVADAARSPAPAKGSPPVALEAAGTGGLALEEEQLRREIAEIEQRSRMEEAARQAVARAEAEAAARAQAEARARDAAARRATEEAARQAREAELRRAAQDRIQREAEQAQREAEAAAAAQREALARRRAEQDRMEGDRIRREQALAQMRAQIAERERERSAERRAEVREEPAWWKGWLVRAGVLVVALAFLLGGLQFLPLPFVTARLEDALSQRIGDVVAIGGTRVALFPMIELRLDQVAFGKERAVRADLVRLRPEPGSLLEEVIRLKRVVIEGAQAEVGAVPAMLRWFPVSPERRNPELGVIELRGGRLGVPDIELPALDGEFQLSADGGLVSGRLTTADEAVKIMFQPGNGGLEVGVLAHAWTPVLGPRVVLDEFQADALLAGGRLRVRSFTGVFAGGVMKGWGDIDWQRGWTASGDYTLERIDARGMLAAAGNAATASGVLEARGGFTMKAEHLSGLFASPAAWGEFAIRGGALHGVDLVRTLQAAPGAVLRGGQTKFDQLRGSFSLNAGRVLYRDLRMRAGALEANGAMEVGEAGRVRGHTVVELRSAARPFRTDLSLGGNLSELTLTP
jgi:chemotaxis protein histidine kinase CheA